MKLFTIGSWGPNIVMLWMGLSCHFAYDNFTLQFSYLVKTCIDFHVLIIQKRVPSKGCLGLMFNHISTLFNHHPWEFWNTTHIWIQSFLGKIITSAGQIRMNMSKSTLFPCPTALHMFQVAAGRIASWALQKSSHSLRSSGTWAAWVIKRLHLVWLNGSYGE